MPFQSEKQRRYLWANEPEIARDWADTYGSRIKKDDGGITRIPFQGGGADAATESFAKSLYAGDPVGFQSAAAHGFRGENVGGPPGITTAPPHIPTVAPDTRPPQLGGPSTLENALKFKQMQAAQAKQLMTQPGVYDDDEDEFSEIDLQQARLVGPALTQYRILDKKVKGYVDGIGWIYGKPTEKEKKMHEKLKKMDAEEKIYKMPILTAAEGGRIEKNDGGITNTKTIKDQPHMLAYITPGEAKDLQKLGGQETMTPEGIPAYPEWDNYGVSKSDFDKGDFTKSTDKTVRDLATGKTGVSATELAATNIAEKKKAVKIKAKEEKKAKKIKVKREKDEKKYREKVYRKRQLIDRKIRQGFKYANPDFNLTRAIKELEGTMPGLSYEEMVNEIISNPTNYGAKEFEEYTPKTEVGKASLKKYPDQIREFYTPIKNPGGLTTGVLTGGANVLGSMMMNKTPYLGEMSRLTGQYGSLTGKGEFGLENIAAGEDIPTRSEFMKEYEPNRWALENDATWNPISGKFEPRPDNTFRGYSSYEEWLAAQQGAGGGGGGGAITPPEEEEEESEFQQSLTTGASSPFDYHVGPNPTAANLAWGKKFNVDPRTMYQTSWAAEGGRIPAAFGGIMDSSTGRRAYGLGSIFKSIKRAAKKVIKSPLGKAALIGAGAYFMPGIGAKAAGGWAPWAQGLKSKWGIKQLLTKEGLGKAWDPWKLGILGASALPFFMGGKEEDDDDGFDYDATRDKYAAELMNIKAAAMAGTLDPTKFRYQGIKEGGRIGFDNGGFTMDDSLAEEDRKVKESYKAYERYKASGGTKSYGEFIKMIGVGGLAEGGRTGYYTGKSVPSDYTMEDAVMSTTQDKLGGITDVMKQADLFRAGDVGQFYAADGGRIGYGVGGQTGHPPITIGQVPQAPQAPQANKMAGALPPTPMPAPQPNRMAGMPGGMNPMMRGNPMMNRPMMNRPMMGGRMMAQEGGLMDLGGMEKDYRQEGGFVPLGGEEKADDVPARLSKNEFVFTADAVRGAGGGDIDKGAEIMENVMENLEEGGNISEESQGLEGAQNMFATAQRLGGVI